MSNPFTIQSGDIISHFKRHLNTPNENWGNKYLYQVLCIAQHTETGEPMMIYQALYRPFKTYARPLSMVYDPVDKVKYPNATQQYRFELVGQEEL